jgi:nucleoside-diphosphate-sugar epimerase
MKIIITGASGFVGTNLTDYLKTSHNVSGHSVRFISEQRFDFKEDSIIHLAGKAHDLKNVFLPKEYFEANFELTKQIFDAFLKSNASTFIFMSTVKAVADQVEGILTEESIPDPKTYYGIAKQQAEQYILSHQIPRGKRVFVLRPCMIHGPGNKGNLNLLYQLVSKGFPWPLGSFENQRSFLSIENLCFVTKELLENTAIPSGIYQVADEQPLSTNEIVNLLGTSLNKKSRIWNIPIPWINGISRLGDYLNLPLNSERLHKLTEDYVISNSKIMAAIGKPLPLASAEGILKTFESFKL